MGITAHWIDVLDDEWILRGSAIAFKGVAGNHSGRNLARYFWACGKRVGMFDVEQCKVTISSNTIEIQNNLTKLQLYGLTLDNTSNNDTLAKNLSEFISRRTNKTWDNASG